MTWNFIEIRYDITLAETIHITWVSECKTQGAEEDDSPLLGPCLHCANHKGTVNYMEYVDECKERATYNVAPDKTRIIQRAEDSPQYIRSNAANEK